MSTDLIAISIPHDEVISGSWAGDVLFNSNIELASIDAVFSVALHEAGHVLGLGHSQQPNSPMSLHDANSVDTPTAEDIASLRRLYGVPTPDIESEDGDTEDGDHHEEADHEEAEETSVSNESEYEREHSDDELQNATAIELSPQFQGAIRYDATGQIFDALDRDFFQLTSVEQEVDDVEVLTVTVRSTATGALIPSVTIVDESGEAVESTVLANHNGRIVIEAEADPRESYIVSVAAQNPDGPHAVGPYEMVATYGLRYHDLDLLAASTLAPESPSRVELLHVNETKLLHFLLEVDPVETVAPTVAWMVLYDEAGNLIMRTAAQPGDSRSANTVLLTSGNYRLETHYQSDDADIEVDYRLLIRTLSLPIGPDLIDVTNTAALPCGESDVGVCISEQDPVNDPVIFPDPSDLITTPATPPPSPVADSSNWFWDIVDLTTGSGSTDLEASTASNVPETETSAVAPPQTNSNTPSVPPSTTVPTVPTASTPSASTASTSSLELPVSSRHNDNIPNDVNGDGRVSPFDLLLLFNHLTTGGTQGSSYLDVNGDEVVSHADVRLVFTALNGSPSTSSVAAEGENQSMKSTPATPATTSQASPNALLGPAAPDASVLPAAVLPRTPNASTGDVAEVLLEDLLDLFANDVANSR